MQAHAHAAIFQPIAIRADLMERDQVVLMEFCLVFFFFSSPGMEPERDADETVVS